MLEVFFGSENPECARVKFYFCLILTDNFMKSQIRGNKEMVKIIVLSKQSLIWGIKPYAG